ncbi:MAG: ribosomal protein S18-alanine N-acetyltransferase [Deltaproteobacteria bacterium]|nr:ribosomal protein S18-alanine N-acetyltransferase [Deltaproteobacteria bacterium]
MSNVTIGDASLEDLDALHAIEVRSFAHPWSRRMLAKEFEHPWSRQRAARDEAGVILGYLICWLVADECNVLDVAVDPDARRKGVGRALLEDCAEIARAAGSETITLEVRRSNEGARSLYRDLGFRMVGERPRYYDSDHEDAVLLEWQL